MTHLIFVMLCKRLRAEGDPLGAAALAFIGVLHAHKAYDGLLQVAALAKCLADAHLPAPIVEVGKAQVM